jgi:hypothetical protein
MPGPLRISRSGRKLLPMRRLLAAIALMLVATTALAFDSSKSDERIGVLRGMSEAESLIARSLLTELRNRGLDAFDAGVTYEELMDEEAVPIAGYVIELRGDTRTADYGGIDVAGRHADVSLGLVVSKLASELRVYDGHTMTLVASADLSKRSTALLPTSVGIGGGAVFAYVVLPFVERVQHRNVARRAARDAAEFVASVVAPE